VRFRFLWIGKTKDRLLLGLEERYLGRIGTFFPVERTVVAEAKKISPGQLSSLLDREADAVEKKLSPNGFRVVLDERGDQFSSLEFAKRVEEIVGRPVQEVVFVAGGFYGVPERLIASADMKLSLTKWTLPHELARVVLLEQVYRSMTIMKGLPYHK
jgi:23S rRNA (pseudouridine1915-N3)-methyltransferase